MKLYWYKSRNRCVPWSFTHICAQRCTWIISLVSVILDVHNFSARRQERIRAQIPPLPTSFIGEYSSQMNSSWFCTRLLSSCLVYARINVIDAELHNSTLDTRHINFKRSLYAAHLDYIHHLWQGRTLHYEFSLRILYRVCIKFLKYDASKA